MEEKFVIPMRPENLLDASEGVFGVQEVFSISGLSKEKRQSALEEVQMVLKDDGMRIVENEHFDIIYSFLRKFQALVPETRLKLVEAIQEGLRSMRFQAPAWTLYGSEAEMEDVDAGDIQQLRNGLQMISYLTYWLITLCEAAEADDVLNAALKKGGKRRGKGVPDKSFWSDTIKCETLNLLAHLLDLDFARIWSLPIPEESFINLYAKSCYAILESAETAKAGVVFLTPVTAIFDAMVMRYEQLPVIVSSLINALMSNANMVSCIAGYIKFTSVSAVYRGALVERVLDECAESDADELNRNNEAAKAVGNLLIEVSLLSPKEVWQRIDHLLLFLDRDPYLMRNAVIQVIANLMHYQKDYLDRITSGEEDEEALKMLQDEGSMDAVMQLDHEQKILDTKEKMDRLVVQLMKRLRDVSGYTRSRTLQAWSELVEAKVVPAGSFAPLAGAAAERLSDKTTLVRKYAAVLLTNLLAYNPFGPVLPLKALKAKQESIMKDKGEGDPVLGAAITFAEHLSSAIPDMCSLLGGNVKTDVVEVISFFATAHRFQIQAADQGIRKMLTLVYSKDSGICDAVLDCYEELCCAIPESVAEEGVESEHAFVARNLIRLVRAVPAVEYPLVQELVSKFIQRRVLTIGHQDMCVDIAGGAVSGFSVRDSAAALLLLSMMAHGDPTLLIAHTGKILGAAFGERWIQYPELAQNGATVLRKVLAGSRLPEDHPVVERLTIVLEDNQCPLDSWFAAAESCLNTLYAIAAHPDQVVERVLKQRSAEMAGSSRVNEVSRLLYMLGQVAGLALRHLESIQADLEKRRSNGGERNKDSAMQDTAIELELGTAALEEENEKEWIADTIEKELVGDENTLLGAFAPWVVELSKTALHKVGAGSSQPYVTHAAVHCLARFMMVSQAFCDAQLRFLFTLFQKASMGSIRASIAISLGDLNVRFPNLLEPWTKYLYKGLNDREELVRKNSLLVLTHLILHDLIKVKGYLSEVALRLEDSSTRIVEVTRLFFHELSLKGNTIYNIMPDMISRLSSSPVEREGFRRIIKFLMSFLTKDKQHEGLVEKLCHRFASVKNSAQRRLLLDIAFCLSLINYSDKAIRKLVDLQKTYADQLADNEMYSLFQKVTAKAKKSSKSETKLLVEELEAQMLVWRGGEVVVKEEVVDAENAANVTDDSIGMLPIDA